VRTKHIVFFGSQESHLLLESSSIKVYIPSKIDLFERGFFTDEFSSAEICPLTTTELGIDKGCLLTAELGFAEGCLLTAESGFAEGCGVTTTELGFPEGCPHTTAELGIAEEYPVTTAESGIEEECGVTAESGSGEGCPLTTTELGIAEVCALTAELGFSEVCALTAELGSDEGCFSAGGCSGEVCSYKLMIVELRRSTWEISTREIEVFASKLCPYRLPKIGFLVLAGKMEHAVLGSLMLVGW